MPKWICPCCNAEFYGWAGRYQASPCCGARLEEAETPGAPPYDERRERL